MQTNRLKTYAPKARRDFIAAVTRCAGLFGLTATGIAPAREEGELLLIDGQPHPRWDRRAIWRPRPLSRPIWTSCARRW